MSAETIFYPSSKLSEALLSLYNYCSHDIGLMSIR